MSQGGEVWARARGDEGNGSAAVQDALRMAEEVARVTLEQARATAEQMRADAEAKAASIRAEAEAIRAAAEDDAERIRADARAEAKQFAGDLKAMEAEIESLGRQLSALEARKVAPPPPVVAPAPMPSREPDLHPAPPAPVVPRIQWTADDVDDRPDAETVSDAVPAKQQHLSPIPLEAVLPMVALVLLLIVVLAWLG